MFDIIGDIHNCSEEFFALLDKLGYKEKGGIRYHPDNRIIILTGDFCDRGPNFTPLFLFVRNMFNMGLLKTVMGNHDNKLMRMCKGNKVQRTHGIDKSELSIIKAEENGIYVREDVQSLIEKWPYYLILDGGKLIVTHAAWEKSISTKNPTSGEVKSYCLFGPVAGYYDGGMPKRIDWAADYKSDGEIIVVGHQVVKEPRIINNVYQIDTGCVFGGSLSAISYPEMKITQIKAFQKWDDSNYSDNILNS